VNIKSVSWKFSDKLFFLSSFLPVAETIYLLSGRFSFYTFLNGIPITDSKVWFGCIKSLAYDGSWPVESEDWCLRRPFYPLVASQIYKVVPSLDVYFIFCSTIFTLILLFAVTQVRKVCGDFAGWVTILGSSALWFVYGATQTLSEQAGITLGTLGLGFFMRYIYANQNLNLYLGSIFFLTAQLTRPGNVFSYMVPLLILVLFGNQRLRVLVRLIAFSYLPLVMLVVTVRKFMGISNFMHSGNTWATIYGLQFDNQSWASSYSILPKDISGEIAIWDFIKQRTLQDIAENPLNIPTSILQNAWNITNFWPLNPPIFLVLFALFTFCIFLVYKNSILQAKFLVLVTFALISELITYGISYNSDPVRTMSTTLTFSATIIVLPISAYLRYVWLSSRATFHGVRTLSLSGSRNLPWFVTVFALIVVSVALFTPQGKQNEYSMSDIGDGCVFRITLSEFPSSFVQHQDLQSIRGTHGEWWVGAIERLGTGSLLLVTSVDETGAARDSSIYLRNYFVGDVRKGDVFCVKTSKDSTLAELGFQEGFLLN
jgi:hypothetical protein